MKCKLLNEFYYRGREILFEIEVECSKNEQGNIFLKSYANFETNKSKIGISLNNGILNYYKLSEFNEFRLTFKYNY